MLRSIRPTAKLRSQTLNVKRGFSQYRPLKSGHDDHGEQLGDEENFSENRTTIGIIIGLTLAGVYGYANSSYTKNHEGDSLYTKVFGKVTPPEKILDENKAYGEQLKVDTDLREAMTLPGPERTFYEYTPIQLIPRGSPANYHPGTHLDIHNLGPRRKPKSIFD